MTIDDFAKAMANEIMDAVPQDVPLKDIEIVHVLKQNDVEQVGLKITLEIENLGAKIHPIIYVNDAYDKCEAIDKVSGAEAQNVFYNYVHEFAGIISGERRGNNMRQTEMTLDNVKDHIRVKLLNAEKNSEYLVDKVYKEVEDLAMVYIIKTDEPYGVKNGVITITNDLRKQLGITLDELDEIAKKNMSKAEAEFRSLSELVLEMMPPEMHDTLSPEEIKAISDCPIPMYVLSNIERTNGAAMLFSDAAMEQVREKIGDNVIIIPSSVHEVIILKDTGELNYDDVKALVGEVNMTEIRPEEVLSDNIYSYDFKEKTLSIIEDSRQLENDDYDDREL